MTARSARSDPQASKIMAGGGCVAAERNGALAECREAAKADKVACRDN